MSISFDNTEIAFAYKSDKDLKSAKNLFSAMSYSLLSSLGTRFTPFLVKTGLPINGLIRKTIFKQFVGGETLEETGRVCNMLNEYNVSAILDYGVEGKESEESFEHATEEFIRVIRFAATQKNIPLIAIKITGLARFKLLEKLNEAPRLRSGVHDNEMQEIEWAKVRERLVRICDVAKETNIGILVDAEESWIQDPIDRITMEMMELYNTEKPLVYNTIQLYRQDRLQFLKMSHDIARQQNFILAVKLVRGAYMEKERARAMDKGYSSPIQKNKEATDLDYNLAVKYCFDNIETVSYVIATHNELSALKAAEQLEEKGLQRNHPNVHFSQLYGMNDNMTFNLAKNGFSVSKYLPFGPIRDVIPYLMRRAQENSSVKGQTSRELSLINKEISRRKNVTQQAELK
ncbi:proline dehydrogenase family protein [Arachidicoccus sp.]|uniref:proline dehydrogenase family protein n=1 Tax=Arachidicoccus sp. TaxID=1872624 RepID=UPI003D20011A